MISKRRLGPWFLFALLIVLAVASIRVVAVFLDWILVGLFVGYITYPIYQKLQRMLKRKQLSALLMLVFVVAALIVPMVFLSLQLADELQAINDQLGLRDPQEFIDETSRALGAAVGIEASNTTAAMVQSAYDSTREFLDMQVRNLPGAIANAAIGAFVLFYILYYAYLDGPSMLRFIRELLPMDEGHRDMLLHEVALVIRAVLYGTVLTALLQAALGVIGFLLFGVPNVLFWGVIMFILALLPVVGPPLIWAPWGIYLVAQGETFRGVGLLIYSAILVSTVDNIVRPQLIGSVAKIHPAIVLLGVLGGVVVFGLPGFLLGPLVLSIFVTILQVYRKEFMSRMDDVAGREVWLR